MNRILGLKVYSMMHSCCVIVNLRTLSFDQISKIQISMSSRQKLGMVDQNPNPSNRQQKMHFRDFARFAVGIRCTNH